MKWFVVVALAIASTVFVVGPGLAGQDAPQRNDIAILKRQVAALTKQTKALRAANKALRGETKTLRADVKSLHAEVKAISSNVSTTLTTQTQSIDRARKEISADFVADGCLVGAVADLFISTWATADQIAQKVDQLAQLTGQGALFGAQMPFPAQAPFDDTGACAKLINPPVLRQTAVPPSLSTLSALIAWIRP